MDNKELEDYIDTNISDVTRNLYDLNKQVKDMKKTVDFIVDHLIKKGLDAR